MKLFPKLPTQAELAWFFSLSAGLGLLYVLFQQIGFSSNDSKGLSLLALLLIIAVGMIAYRKWLKKRWNGRFEGLSLEQQILELDKVFEEQVAAGIITREELNAIRANAKATFEREGFSGKIDDKSV